MKVAVLFPGQGAQHPGMLGPLEDDPSGLHTLTEAAGPIREAIGLGIEDLDSPEVLAGTVGTQLALLITGIGSGRAIVAEIGPPFAVAGHSVGAFAAAVVAGVLTLDQGVRAVRLRAEMMERLFPSGYGMAAVTGLSPLAATRLGEELGVAEDELWVANVNGDDQTVFAGTDGALDRLAERGAVAGARSVRRLAVGVPSHGVALRPVADALAGLFAAVEDRPSPVPCSSNVTGRLLHTSAAIRADLALLTARSVQWRDAVAILVESGAGALVQARPGRVLVDLATRQCPHVPAFAASDTMVGGLAKRLEGKEPSR